MEEVSSITLCGRPPLKYPHLRAFLHTPPCPLPESSAAEPRTEGHQPSPQHILCFSGTVCPAFPSQERSLPTTDAAWPPAQELACVLTVAEMSGAAGDDQHLLPGSGHPSFSQRRLPQTEWNSVAFECMCVTAPL